jgi:peptide/nickel transport system substrate-binding protein
MECQQGASGWPSRVLAATVAMLLVLSACGGAPRTDPTVSAGPQTPRGGTLRIIVPQGCPPPSALAACEEVGDPAVALDPHGAIWYDSLELMRCCLLRTLVSYEGRPTEQGGTVLRPDLAESLPEVSEDGLTWTFRLRSGIRYAPPLDEFEVTSADVVRALLRGLSAPGLDAVGFATLNQLGIVGVEEFVAGEATTVSGFETPDEHTLRVRLTRPAGDLPARFAVPDTAPIPPSPSDPRALFGAATGHDDDYGRFVVGTGPYMVEGSDVIDFGAAPEEQEPASGFVPGRSLTLVRNPSWQAATDALRPARVDEIEVTIGGDLEEASARVDDGEFDFVMYSGPPPQAPPEQIERYDADPALGTVHIHSRDFVRAITMNLAIPPFDDVQVRKAVNYVIDKAELIELSGGPLAGEVAGHIVLNSLEDNLLLSYDPYATPGSAGDVERARAQMRESRYDTDGDGRCDDPVCEAVPGIAFLINPEMATSVAADLAEIGIQADIVPMPPQEAFTRWSDPTERFGLFAGLAYGKDILNAAPFFRSLFDSRWTLGDEFTNGTLVGATPELLSAWGYEPMELPSIDDRIDACLAEAPGSQAQCWAALDQYMMEEVVPWVPYVFERYTRPVSARVVNYSFDQLMAQPALDQIAVAPED